MKNLRMLAALAALVVVTACLSLGTVRMSLERRRNYPAERLNVEEHERESVAPVGSETRERIWTCPRCDGGDCECYVRPEGEQGR